MILTRLGMLSKITSLPLGVRDAGLKLKAMNPSLFAGLMGMGRSMDVGLREFHSSPIAAKFLKPTSDIAFKRLFGDERNKDITIDFLNSLLEIEGSKRIEEIVHLNIEIGPSALLGKRTFLDILCKDERGELFIVEMQRRFEPSFEERAQYYVASKIGGQLGRTDPYHILKPVYFIGILEHKFYPESDGVRIFDIAARDNPDYKMKLMKWMLVELPKITSATFKNHPKAVKWLTLLKEAEELEEIPSDIDSPALRKAYEELDEKNFSLTEKNDIRLAEETEAIFAGTIQLALEREKQALERAAQYREEKEQALERAAQYREEKEQVLEKIMQLKKQTFLSLSKIKGTEEAARDLNLSKEEISAFNSLPEENSSFSSSIKGLDGIKGVRHFSTFTLTSEITPEEEAVVILDHHLPLAGEEAPGGL